MTEEAQSDRAKGDRIVPFWMRTNAFKKMCKWAFDVCDKNKTGAINKTELYVGLLLVHVKLAKYAGPAACYPPSREVVDMLFDATDDDKSGGIDEEEFMHIVVILCSQITSRMILYYSILILAVPYIIKGFLNFLDIIGVDDAILAFDKRVWDEFAPSSLQYVTNLIPDSFWASLPATLVSTALFYLVIPVCFNYVDEVLKRVAENTDTSGQKTD